MRWFAFIVMLTLCTTPTFGSVTATEESSRTEERAYLAPPAQGNIGIFAGLSARSCWDSITGEVTGKPPFDQLNGACFVLDGTEQFITIVATDDAMPEPLLRLGFGWGTHASYLNVIDDHYLCGAGTVPVPVPEWREGPPDWIHIVVGQAADDDYAFGENGSFPGEPTDALADCEALGQATRGTLFVTFT